MRIIEPHQLRHQRTKRRTKPLRLFASLGVLAVVTGIVWLVQRPQSLQTSDTIPNTTERTTVEQSQAEPSKPVVLKQFTPDQFRDLYQTLAYPNIQEISDTTIITGNTEADKRIVAIAESRGYRRTSVPVAPIVKINEPGLEGDDLLQQKAYDGWKALKALAEEDGVPIKLLSAYRSPEYQRQIFTSRLYATGATAESIAAGASDAQVEKTLALTAVPGYSRHHTGYTIDLLCNPGYFVQFADSICYRWISGDNYEKAKLAGWVPSYPAGTTMQGPEPEPWEYVWVGTAAVSE